MRSPHIRRARAAARFLLAYAQGGEPPGREYDACFEAGDGAKVTAHLARLASMHPDLAEAVRGKAGRYCPQKVRDASALTLQNLGALIPEGGGA